jgi:hypothetical protein
MASPRTLAACLLLSVAVSGCILYDDDDGCPYGGIRNPEGAAVYDPGLRNPYTGQCEYFGYPPDGCDDPCGCPTPAGAADQAQPTWGVCEGPCTGLVESDCQATSGCRAIYVGDAYMECWATDMTGPIEGGSCEGLDALTCSQHDDCSAVHQNGCRTDDGSAIDLPTCIGAFDHCIAEDPTGGAGHCDGELTCAEDPPLCPDGTMPGIADGCYTGYCIPVAKCDGALDPGLCYDVLTCESPSPACPDGTTPGIEDGCYTGYCIPLDRCERTATCAEITVEATCIARSDCEPLYEGVDCTCDGDACTCADWVFTACR